jgi:transcriptional regulator with XRE-family HTH domain
VKSLREERGLRQEDLEDYGLSWKSVQKLEYGITDPKVSTLLKLAAAFGLSLGDLLDVASAGRRTAARPTRRRG